MATRFEILLPLVLNQFRTKPNMTADMSVKFNRIADSDAVLDYLLNKRDLDNSEGVWLDNNGDIVGFHPRPNQYIPADNIFTLKDNPGDPDDPNKGFASTPALTDGGYWQSETGLVQEGVFITDTVYKQYVKAKAKYTFLPATAPNLYGFIQEAFGIDVDIAVTNYKEVTLTCLEPSGFTNEQRFLIQQYAPMDATERLVLAW